LIFLASVFLLLSLYASKAHEFRIGSIKIEHPWARATPAGAKVGGGYIVIDNEGPSSDRLVSATAEIAGHVEIHEMTMKDGVMSMRQLDGVPLPSKSSVAFTPGSFHLMFLDLKQPLVEGKPFSGTLTFEKAGTVNVTFVVVPIGGNSVEHDKLDHSSQGR
jgi:copper(I)-binding protein